MHKIKMRLEGREGQLIREVEVEAAFLPRVGDTINAYSHFDDVDAQLDGIGWFFIIYDIQWAVDGTLLVPTLRLCSSKLYDRLDILRRHEWLPKSTAHE